MKLKINILRIESSKSLKSFNVATNSGFLIIWITSIYFLSCYTISIFCALSIHNIYAYISNASSFLSRSTLRLRIVKQYTLWIRGRGPHRSFYYISLFTF